MLRSNWLNANGSANASEKRDGCRGMDEGGRSKIQVTVAITAPLAIAAIAMVATRGLAAASRA